MAEIPISAARIEAGMRTVPRQDFPRDDGIVFVQSVELVSVRPNSVGLERSDIDLHPELIGGGQQHSQFVGLRWRSRENATRIDQRLGIHREAGAVPGSA
jgi:hypothetical protein